MGLTISALIPITSTALLATIPRSIGGLFLAHSTENSTVPLERLGIVGAIACGALIPDTTRLNAGLFLMNHGQANIPALVGIVSLWVSFGLGVLLNQFFGLDPLMAFAVAGYVISFSASYLVNLLYKTTTPRETVLVDALESTDTTIAIPRDFPSATTRTEQTKSWPNFFCCRRRQHIDQITTLPANSAPHSQVYKTLST